jgi:hypothetical protein
MGPRAKALYRAVVKAIAACGSFHISPAKTRITFLGRVRFAGITAVSERGLTLTFALPRPLRSARFLRVYEVAPGWWAHRLRLTHLRQLDAQVRRWLRRSYQLMGMQLRLRGADR